jgi:hypothetical protein
VLDFYIKTPSGDMIPASTVATIKYSVQPESITRFQQLNSATISGVIRCDAGRDAAVPARCRRKWRHPATLLGRIAPVREESGGFLVTMLFAVIIVFLALAAQFESFRDPMVILFSVPMALFGAMTFIFLGFASINIYTQVGLVTLMGLISKHGILIVEVANHLREAGKSKREAIEEAAATRLRPILMTTAAMVFGVVPLVIASGAGAAGRHAMGLVIFTGLSIGTLFTLFVVPAMYMFLPASTRSIRRHRQRQATAVDRSRSGADDVTESEDGRTIKTAPALALAAWRQEAASGRSHPDAAVRPKHRQHAAVRAVPAAARQLGLGHGGHGAGAGVCSRDRACAGAPAVTGRQLAGDALLFGRHAGHRLSARRALVYWVYPTTIAAYFVLRPRVALAINSVGLVVLVGF